MVHLYINIQMIVTIPRGLNGVGPQPLQVGRQQVLTCGTDEQVTAVMEIAHGQPRVVIHQEVIPMLLQSKVLVFFWFANLQLHAVEKLLIGFQMVVFYRLKAFFNGFL